MSRIKDVIVILDIFRQMFGITDLLNKLFQPGIGISIGLPYMGLELRMYLGDGKSNF